MKDKVQAALLGISEAREQALISAAQTELEAEGELPEMKSEDTEFEDTEFDEKMMGSNGKKMMGGNPNMAPKKAPMPPNANANAPAAGNQQSSGGNMFEFKTPEEAKEKARKLGCSGFHKKGMMYLPCESSEMLKRMANMASDAEKSAYIMESLEIKSAYEFPGAEIVESGWAEDEGRFLFHLKYESGEEQYTVYEADGRWGMSVRADLWDPRHTEFYSKQAGFVAEAAFPGDVKSVTEEQLEDGRYVFSVVVENAEDESYDVLVSDSGKLIGLKSAVTEPADDETEVKSETAAQDAGEGEHSPTPSPAEGAADVKSETESETEEKPADVKSLLAEFNKLKTEISEDTPGEE